mmetsp:Transcript_40467/g.102898  ORF Transcript_40467/g.102898 Transcript_40467/m.102898 type:complete len:205 (-) Transcript_40467:8-622(-)
MSLSEGARSGSDYSRSLAIAASSSHTRSSRPPRQAPCRTAARPWSGASSTSSPSSGATSGPCCSSSGSSWSASMATRPPSRRLRNASPSVSRRGGSCPPRRASQMRLRSTWTMSSQTTSPSSRISRSWRWPACGRRASSPEALQCPAENRLELSPSLRRAPHVGMHEQRAACRAVRCAWPARRRAGAWGAGLGPQRLDDGVPTM